MGADPDEDRGLRHLAPTYISRDTGILAPTAIVASPSSLQERHRMIAIMRHREPSASIRPTRKAGDTASDSLCSLLDL